MYSQFCECESEQKLNHKKCLETFDRKYKNHNCFRRIKCNFKNFSINFWFEAHPYVSFGGFSSKKELRKA